MPHSNLLHEIDLSEDDLQREIDAAFGPGSSDWLSPDTQMFHEDRMVTGRVTRVSHESVHVDVGYKSEGVLDIREWRDENGIFTPPRPGDEVALVFVAAEDQSGSIVLSYRKALRYAAWEKFAADHNDGDIVSGMVTRKVAGGLLVDVGVSAFLPSSQIDLRRVQNLDDYIGQYLDCAILKIDRERRNVVLSRRQMQMWQRVRERETLLADLEVGQIRKGVVKNIAAFGAFIDLGGIDGLLHVSDMSWGRVNDPNTVVRLNQPIEVYVLKVDRETDRIALSLKHKTPSPWVSAAEVYPVGSRQMGTVTNVMSYGAFVKLEPGIEGLVHISEMSWTRRLNHPSEMVSVGQSIHVQVLAIDTERGEISLGMRQLTPNPWDGVPERYPPGMVVSGTVRNLTNYGAFVTIEEGIEGLLHVADMSWTRKVQHPSEVVQKGEQILLLVVSVDTQRRRMMLGLKQMTPDPWQSDIPERYRGGEVRTGRVRKVTNFGVFVELEPELEGLLHVSELGDGKVSHPEEVVQVGDELTVRILRVDTVERRIALTRVLS